MRAVLLVVALASAAAGCSDARSADDLDVVRISTQGRLSGGAMFLAEEYGFFEREGIRLEVVETLRSGASLPLLDRGDLDVLGGNPSAAIFAGIENGAAFRIVGGRTYHKSDHCPISAIMGRRESFSSDSPSGDEVRGRRFSITPFSLPAYIADLYLQSIGLTIDDVEVVRLGETVEVQALESGAIEAMHVSEPYLTPMRERGHRLLAVTKEIIPDATVSMLLFGKRFIQEDRDLGLRFMRAYLRGVREYARGPTSEHLDIIARRGNYDRSSLANVCLPAADPRARVNMDVLNAFQLWAAERGYINTAGAADNGIDLWFVRQALATLDAEDASR